MKLYNVADFDNVTVGSTTYSELCETIGMPSDPSEGLYAFSYGGACVYYLDDGRYALIVVGYQDDIVVKFKICEYHPCRPR